MYDPSLAIQDAVLATLLGNTGAGDNVFDTVPASDPFPRITIGEGQSVGDFADCYEGTETSLQIDVWSTAPGFPEAKSIAGEVRGLLHGADLVLVGHTMSLCEFQSALDLRDPDGITRHVAMTFRLLTQRINESG